MKKAIIVVRDEVNCAIKDLDLDMRKKLVRQFKYDIPNAKFMPAYRLGRWDGTVSFFNLGGSTYLNLLPEILPTLINDGWEIEIDDQREYETNFDLGTVDQNTFSHVMWPKDHPVEGQPIVLRDYQIEIVNDFLKNPQCLQEIATGAGKTLITATLSQRIESYGRSIVIVPNKSLVVQTEEDYINMQLDVGVFFGDRKELGKQHTICTWQSLNSLMKNTKAGKGDYTIAEFLEGAVCVMVDECFDGNTLIKTPAGDVPIKDINEGDVIINLDEAQLSYKEDTVLKVHKNLLNSQSEEMLELTFNEGQVVKVTANHKFLTTAGWVRADRLTEDLEVIDINTYN